MRLMSPKIPRYLRKVDETMSEVAIPLLVRDEVVGVLDFQSEQVDYFDPEKIDLLTLFSTQASMALENARLYSTERRRTKQLEAINAVAKKTTRVLGPGRTAHRGLPPADGACLALTMLPSCWPKATACVCALMKAGLRRTWPWESLLSPGTGLAARAMSFRTEA